MNFHAGLRPSQVMFHLEHLQTLKKMWSDGHKIKLHHPTSGCCFTFCSGPVLHLALSVHWSVTTLSRGDSSFSHMPGVSFTSASKHPRTPETWRRLQTELHTSLKTTRKEQLMLSCCVSAPRSLVFVISHLYKQSGSLGGYAMFSIRKLFKGFHWCFESVEKKKSHCGLNCCVTVDLQEAAGGDQNIFTHSLMFLIC